MIGEATKTIVEGNTHPLSIMRLRSQEGSTIYALQQARWGIFKDAYNKKDRFVACNFSHIPFYPHLSFWLFGPLRTLVSYVYTAIKVTSFNLFYCACTRFYLQAWPEDYQLRIQSPQQNDVAQETTELKSWNVLGFDMYLSSQVWLKSICTNYIEYTG